ncbi:MAG: hypothetical protein IGR92_01890 [Leptolyngbyaceae cyanobacterium T60_A2020_046]|nr:hypothetical protein [Leptolyngbyaceae cyanobacterium T60_A2020_046]
MMPRSLGYVFSVFCQFRARLRSQLRSPALNPPPVNYPTLWGDSPHPRRYPLRVDVGFFPAELASPASFLKSGQQSPAIAAYTTVHLLIHP